MEVGYRVGWLGRATRRETPTPQETKHTQGSGAWCEARAQTPRRNCLFETQLVRKHRSERRLKMQALAAQERVARVCSVWACVFVGALVP
jgi:hypothetical protein